MTGIDIMRRQVGRYADVITASSTRLTFYVTQKSVRHNLSSNRAFRKIERSPGERGKGYYWAVEEEFEHIFEEQEARAQTGASGAGGGGKDGKGGSKKTKGGALLLEPP